MKKIHVFGENATIVDSEVSTHLALGDEPDEILEYNQENLDKYNLTSKDVPQKVDVVQLEQ